MSLPPALSLAVVGANHPNKRGPTRRFEIAICKPGEPVELRLEPKNKADSHAVAVFSSRGVQLGYVTAERAPRIGKLMREGREVAAVFQEATYYGAVIRAAFDGDAPELPPHRPSRPLPQPPRQVDPKQDFSPDPEWPD